MNALSLGFILLIVFLFGGVVGYNTAVEKILKLEFYCESAYIQDKELKRCWKIQEVKNGY